MDDAACVHACLDGQPDAYRLLVRRHEPALRGYLAARLEDAEAAADAVQESFVRAYFRLSTLQTPAAFGAWLLGIADRVAHEQRRAQGRRRAAEARADREPGAPAEAMPGEWCVSGGHAVADPDPELARALARLPALYAEVIRLRYDCGLTCNDIAARLGVPIATVTKRLSRAYAFLRETLGPRGAS